VTQLRATVATLRALKGACPGPLCIARLICKIDCRSASIIVSAIGSSVTVKILLDGAPNGWASDIVSGCEVPELFAFGVLRFVKSGRICAIDPVEFMAGPMESTVAATTDEGHAEVEFLSVDFGTAGKAWLNPNAHRKFLSDYTWVGSSTNAAAKSVQIRCLGQDSLLQQPRVNTRTLRAEHTSQIGQRLLIASATAQLRCGSAGELGKVRHRRYGVIGTTRALFDENDDGVEIDVDFEVTPAVPGLSGEMARQEFSNAKPTLGTWLKQLKSGGWTANLLARAHQTKVAMALGALEARRGDLETCSYVWVGRRRVYRTPRNENELVLLFAKLETLKAIPFACDLLEYTAKRGIDAIGHYKLTPNVIEERYAPIEFEKDFESFITHGHPPEQTKLIVCWSADDTQEYGLQDTEHGWLKYYPVGPTAIPVVVVSEFPNIQVKGK